LRGQLEGFRRRDANVYAVTTGTPADTAAFCEQLDVPFPCLVDRPGEPGYRAFGLDKVGLLRLFGPNPIKSLWTVARRFREVRNPPSGDVFQMSGTFVIDGRGIVRLAHRSRYPNDHVETERIWACLDALADRARSRSQP